MDLNIVLNLQRVLPPASHCFASAEFQQLGQIPTLLTSRLSLLGRAALKVFIAFGETIIATEAILKVIQKAIRPSPCLPSFVLFYCSLTMILAIPIPLPMHMLVPMILAPERLASERAVAI
jgi:hypothetical protein